MTIEQGADYTEKLTVLDTNGDPVELLTGGYTSSLQVKRNYKDGAPIVLLFTTQNGGISMEPSGQTGLLVLNITSAETDALGIPNRILDCEYEWELTDGTGYVRRIYDGEFTISKNLKV